jgi:hypothetical protein
MFTQVSVARFKKTGARALVSGSQVFTLDIPHIVTMTPVDVTVGYREAPANRLALYVGTGLGWQSFTESSPSLEESRSRGRMSFHLLGGAEYPVGPWLSLAGDLQWTTVPGGLGHEGVSALFDEDDLGGTAFRMKVILGR